MKIQYLNGGLANQTFQYIFTRFAALRYPDSEPILLDNSTYWVEQIHNGYELEKVFALHPPLLSNELDDDVWEEFIRLKKLGSSVCQSIADLGIPIEMIAETDNYTERNPFRGTVHRVPSNEFLPELCTLPGNLYYHGYWLNSLWFSSYREAFWEELSFPAITDNRNRDYLDRISSCTSIAVHIRRGDYVTCGLAYPPEVYAKAVHALYENHPEAVFFIFSDDIPWCQANAALLGLHPQNGISEEQLVWVTGNSDGENFRDLQLMSNCRGMLVSNSAFCYLAALLNQHLDFYINITDRKF